MFLDKANNGGSGDFFELAQVLKAPPYTLFCLLRTNDYRVGESADFMFFFSQGNSANTDTASINTESNTFARMVSAGLGVGPELTGVGAELGLWDGAVIDALDGTHQSANAWFSQRAGGGGDYEDEDDVTAAFGAGWDRTRIGRIVGTQGGQSAVHGEVLDAAAWNIKLTLAERRMLVLGQHPLSVRPGSLIAYWPMRGMNLRSWIVLPVDLVINGFPKPGTLPGNRILHGVWSRMEAVPLSATVMQARRMTAR